MLRRKLSSVFRKQWVKYLSTNLSAKTQNEPPEEITTETSKQNDVLQSPDYFNVHNLFTVKDLFDAKVHYGHKEISLERNMKPFVFGSRLGHVIFDLDITAYHLREALNFTAHIAYRNGIILFVSKNPRMTLLVEDTAKACKEYAVTREWMLGTLTNEENYKSFLRLPDMCIFLNTLGEDGRQHLGIKEAAKMCIPVVGIVDSNCNPNLITYPVPGNDDSLSSFQLYCKLFKKAILRGKDKRQEHFEEKSTAKKTAKTVQSNDKTIADSETVLSRKENKKKRVQSNETKLKTSEFDLNVNDKNVIEN